MVRTSTAGPEGPDSSLPFEAAASRGTGGRWGDWPSHGPGLAGLAVGECHSAFQNIFSNGQSSLWALRAVGERPRDRQFGGGGARLPQSGAAVGGGDLRFQRTHNSGHKVSAPGSDLSQATMPGSLMRGCIWLTKLLLRASSKFSPGCAAHHGLTTHRCSGRRRLNAPPGNLQSSWKPPWEDSGRMPHSPF